MKVFYKYKLYYPKGGRARSQDWGSCADWGGEWVPGLVPNITDPQTPADVAAFVVNELKELGVPITITSDGRGSGDDDNYYGRAELNLYPHLHSGPDAQAMLARWIKDHCRQGRAVKI